MAKLKIVIGGYVVSFPLGGQVWMLMHFMEGLSRLGHETNAGGLRAGGHSALRHTAAWG